MTNKLHKLFTYSGTLSFFSLLILLLFILLLFTFIFALFALFLFFVLLTLSYYVFWENYWSFAPLSWPLPFVFSCLSFFSQPNTNSSWVDLLSRSEHACHEPNYGIWCYLHSWEPLIRYFTILNYLCQLRQVEELQHYCGLESSKNLQNCVCFFFLFPELGEQSSPHFIKRNEDYISLAQSLT